MSAVVPIQADVSSRDWLLSGMVVQLLQMRSPLSPTLATSQAQIADSSRASLQQCLARGVLQADALLDGSVQQCSSNLDLMTELPLFDARGVRLGIEHLQDSVHKVSYSWHCTDLHVLVFQPQLVCSRHIACNLVTGTSSVKSTCKHAHHNQHLHNCQY